MKNFADTIAHQMNKIASSKEMEKLFSKYAHDEEGELEVHETQELSCDPEMLDCLKKTREFLDQNGKSEIAMQLEDVIKECSEESEEFEHDHNEACDENNCNAAGSTYMRIAKLAAKVTGKKCKKCRQSFEAGKLTEFEKKMYCKGCLKSVKKEKSK